MSGPTYVVRVDFPSDTFTLALPGERAQQYGPFPAKMLRALDTFREGLLECSRVELALSKWTEPELPV